VNFLCGRSRRVDNFIEVLDSGRPFFFALFALFAFTAASRRTDEERRAFVVCALAVCATLAAAGFIGRVAAGAAPVRPRPFFAFDFRPPFSWTVETWRANMIGERPFTSFPSTHAILGSAPGLALFALRKRGAGAVTTAGLLLMVPGVILLGVHWPSDAAIGVLISAVCALAVATQQDRLAAPARLIVRVWSRWPVATGFVVTVGSAWLIWRAGPHTGVLKSMTGLLRSLLHG